MEHIQAQEVLACLLCGSEGVLLYRDLRDRLFRAPGTWTLLRCSNCPFVWLNPRPVPADVEKLYEGYLTHDMPPRPTRLRRAVASTVLAARMGYSGLANGPFQKGVGKILSWIGPIREMAELSVMTLDGRRRGRLLDVGCGHGYFLAKMRDLGWEGVGVEPDGQAVKVVREGFGLSVHEGTLEEVGFPDDAFDAITLHHVLEHLWDPIATLRECCRVLKPGGKLVVVTPNIESLAHRLFREASVHLDPPRHLYLFSPRTLRVCAERVRLQTLELRTTARNAGWTWTASRLIRRNGALPGVSLVGQGLWIRLEGLAFQAVEHALCRVLDAGEELVLIATK